MPKSDIEDAHIRAAYHRLRCAMEDINAARHHMGAELFDSDWISVLRAVASLKAKVRDQCVHPGDLR